MAGLAYRLHEVECALFAVEEAHLHPRRAHVGGSTVAERDAARDEVSRLRLEGALLRGAAYEGVQLLGHPGRRELFLWLDVHRPKYPIGRTVKPADRPGHRRGERSHRALCCVRDASRQGDREVLRDQLADEHRHDCADRDAQGDGKPGDSAVAHAEVAQRRTKQPGDRGFGEVADEQVRQRDAELRTTELGGQAPKRRGSAGGTTIAALGGALDTRSVDGDEGELGGDENTARQHQEQGEAEQQPLGHLATP